jgi:aspartyl-tRNA(Asn)/glutamyl-tRNA(Gln) amidotransferase subunit A
MLKLTIKEAMGQLATGDLTSEMLVKSYLDNIEVRDKEVQAFLYLNGEAAIEKAKCIDAKRAAKTPVGALAGIPMAIKDNMCTVDMPTTCASKILEGYYSPYNATVVERLNAADAVILGKLNMDEFAMGSTTENSYFQKTHNPYDLERVPGGSSGGSAAAVSASEAMFTLGSDTGGSIRQPASFCGVTGLKPTYGAISRFGLIAFASSLDQIGPIARTAEDIACVLPTLMGHDAKDSTSAVFDVEDYLGQLTQDIRGMKIAIPEAYFGEGLNEEVRKVVLEAAEAFKAMGAKVETVNMTNVAYALPAYYLISSAEASSNLARFDGVQYGYRHDDFETLEELYMKSRSYGFGKEVKRRILLGTYALSSGYYDAYYKKSLQARTLIKRDFDKVFENYDLVLTPVAPTTAYKIGEKSSDPLEMYMGDIYTVPVNIAGLPAISLNAGFDRLGLPVGMQLIGRTFSEATLLKAADAFEKATKGGHK